MSSSECVRNDEKEEGQRVESYNKPEGLVEHHQNYQHMHNRILREDRKEQKGTERILRK